MTITGQVFNDILLLYGLVLHWAPEGVRCKTPGALRTQLGLGMTFLGLVWVSLGASQLGWVYLGLSHQNP